MNDVGESPERGISQSYILRGPLHPIRCLLPISLLRMLSPVGSKCDRIFSGAGSQTGEREINLFRGRSTRWQTGPGSEMPFSEPGRRGSRFSWLPTETKVEGRHDLKNDYLCASALLHWGQYLHFTSRSVHSIPASCERATATQCYISFSPGFRCIVRVGTTD